MWTLNWKLKIHSLSTYTSPTVSGVSVFANLNLTWCYLNVVRVDEKIYMIKWHKWHTFAGKKTVILLLGFFKLIRAMYYRKAFYPRENYDFKDYEPVSP